MGSEMCIRDSFCTVTLKVQDNGNSCGAPTGNGTDAKISLKGSIYNESDEMVHNVQVELNSDQVEFPRSILCLLYTSDAADDLLCVDLGGRRIIKKTSKC